MRKLLVCITGLCLMSMALAADNPAVFGIFAETTEYSIAGAPASVPGTNGAALRLPGMEPTRNPGHSTLVRLAWRPITPRRILPCLKG